MPEYNKLVLLNWGVAKGLAAPLIFLKVTLNENLKFIRLKLQNLSEWLFKIRSNKLF